MDLLNKKFKILNFFILRHPLELYISCFKSLKFFKKFYKFKLFLKGYKEYFLRAKKNKIFKYEDFTQQTNEVLKEMCDTLDLNFNKYYIKKLNDINITGDKTAINSKSVYKKENVAKTIIKKEDQNKIFKYREFIELMEELKNYYKNE